MNGETARCCAICRVDLPEYAGTGRPARYCSTACRRSAEFEVRRINSLLEKLEAELSACMTWGNQSAAAMVCGAEVAMQRLTAEIDRQQARLALLLAD